MPTDYLLHQEFAACSACGGLEDSAGRCGEGITSSGISWLVMLIGWLLPEVRAAEGCCSRWIRSLASPVARVSRIFSSTSRRVLSSTAVASDFCAVALELSSDTI